jgi:hypothetical protein
LDLLRRQRALGADLPQMETKWLQLEWVKNPKGFWLLFISQTGSATAGWLSSRAADSAARRDPSYSTSRRASPRGLGYFYSTTWEAPSLKSISEHILQDDPSIREEVLDSRLGGSVPWVLRFFLSGFFGISLPRLQMDPQPESTTQPKARGLLHMECDFAIAPPY